MPSPNCGSLHKRLKCNLYVGDGNCARSVYDESQEVSDALAASVYGESYWLDSIDQTSWLSDAWLSGFGSIEAAVQKLGRAAAWKNLGSVLAMITRGLVRTHTPLFERIRAEGGQVSLLVQLSSLAVDGFSLTPEVSRQFGDLGITIEFEMTGD
jgi:hypothetical protein